MADTLVESLDHFSEQVSVGQSAAWENTRRNAIQSENRLRALAAVTTALAKVRLTTEEVQQAQRDILSGMESGEGTGTPELLVALRRIASEERQPPMLRAAAGQVAKVLPERVRAPLRGLEGLRQQAEGRGFDPTQYLIFDEQLAPVVQGASSTEAEMRLRSHQPDAGRFFLLVPPRSQEHTVPRFTSRPRGMR